MQAVKKEPSITKNFIMNAILSMSSFIFPLISFPYVSRVLLAEGTGKVAFAISLVSYFIMFAQLGIPVYGIRACARVRDDREKLSRVTHELLFIHLIMAAISYAVFFVCLAAIPKMRDEKTLMIVASGSILLSSIGMEWLYQGLEQYSYITIRSLVFKVISIIAMFLLVHDKDDYVIYGAITVFAAYASCILNFLKAGEYISLKPVSRYDPVRHLKPIIIFFAMTCATTIYNNLDSVMLGFMAADADVGYYNIAWKVKLVLLSFVTSLGTVLFPRSSYYVQQKRYERFHAICYKVLNFVFVVSIPLTVFFIIFADRVISLLATPDFAEAIPTVRILLPTVFMIGVNNILSVQMLIPLGREKKVFYAEAAGAVVDLILDLILIPTLKSAGAAIANLSVETVVTLGCLLALRREVAEGFRRISYLKITVSLVFASVSLCLIRMMTLDDFPALFIGAILFFGVYFLALLLLKESLICEIADFVLEKIKTILR